MGAVVEQIPGFGAGLFVPEGMTDSQTRCHQDEQREDLQEVTEETGFYAGIYSATLLKSTRSSWIVWINDKPSIASF